MKRFLWLLFLVVGTGLGLPVRADDVDYTISSYEGQLVLHADNTADFTQEVTFSYDSSYNGQYVTLGLAGDLPEGAAIIGTPIVTAYRNGTPVSVSVEEVVWDDGRKLKIYNGGQEGDQVVLHIQWQLANLLYHYPDVARLNWVPISDWDMPLERVHFEVVTDKAFDQSELVVHRGYFRPKSEVSMAEQTYRFLATDVTGQLHIHAYWDASVLDGTANLAGSGKSSYQTIEQALKDGQDSLDFRFNRLFIGVVSGSLLLALVIYQRFRHLVGDTRRLPKRVYELPEDLPPLVVARNSYKQSLLGTSEGGWSAGLSFEHLVQATLLDLVDRRFLTIEGTGEQAILKRTDRLGLYPFEASFLEMAMGGHQTCSMDQIFSTYYYDEDKEEQLKERYKGSQLELKVHQLANRYLHQFNKALRRIDRHVDDEIRRLDLSDNYRPLSTQEKRSYGLALTATMIGLALSLYSIFVILSHAFIPAVLSYVLLAAVAIWLMIVMARGSRPYRQLGVVTDEGRQRVDGWNGFWQMLRDLKSFDHVALEGLVVWNRLLVYATLFGQAKQVEQYLNVHRIQLLDDTSLMFFEVHHGRMNHAIAHHLVQSSQSAVSASHFSVSSGSSGVSGGFSGGGGGGGGGSF